MQGLRGNCVNSNRKHPNRETEQLRRLCCQPEDSAACWARAVPPSSVHAQSCCTRPARTSGRHTRTSTRSACALNAVDCRRQASQGAWLSGTASVSHRVGWLGTAGATPRRIAPRGRQQTRSSSARIADNKGRQMLYDALSAAAGAAVQAGALRCERARLACGAPHARSAAAERERYTGLKILRSSLSRAGCACATTVWHIDRPRRALRAYRPQHARARVRAQRALRVAPSTTACALATCATIDMAASIARRASRRICILLQRAAPVPLPCAATYILTQASTRTTKGAVLLTVRVCDFRRLEFARACETRWLDKARLTLPHKSEHGRVINARSLLRAPTALANESIAGDASGTGKERSRASRGLQRRSHRSDLQGRRATHCLSWRAACRCTWSTAHTNGAHGGPSGLPRPVGRAHSLAKYSVRRHP